MREAKEMAQMAKSRRPDLCHFERSREWSDPGSGDMDGKGRRLSERG